MATYSGNTTTAVSAAVAQSLGTYTVPASSYFVGQAALVAGSTGYAQVTVAGQVAAVLVAQNTSPATTIDTRHATIYAGPGQAITLGSSTYGGTTVLSGVVFTNTP